MANLTKEERLKRDAENGENQNNIHSGERAKEPKEYDPQNPNASIAGLNDFDYNKLQGQAFADYNLLMETLPNDKLYDFAVMKVQAIKKTRIAGMKGSPIDVIGIEILQQKPIQEFTRVTVRQAFEMNGRINKALLNEDNIIELIGGQFQHNNRYFLLKQTK